MELHRNDFFEINGDNSMLNDLCRDDNLFPCSVGLPIVTAAHTPTASPEGVSLVTKGRNNEMFKHIYVCVLISMHHMRAGLWSQACPDRTGKVSWTLFKWEIIKATVLTSHFGFSGSMNEEIADCLATNNQAWSLLWTNMHALVDAQSDFVKPISSTIWPTIARSARQTSICFRLLSISLKFSSVSQFKLTTDNGCADLLVRELVAAWSQR